MDSLADLGLRIHSEEVSTANERLDTLTKNAKGAEGATDGLGAASKRTSSAIEAMLANIMRDIAAMTELQRAEAGAAAGASAVGAASAKAATEIKKADEAARLAEKGIKLYAGRMNDMDTHVQAFLKNQKMLAEAHSKGAAGARLQAHETVNLGRQLADVFVTGAMGMNPIMILIQQGPQIADVLSMAAARGVTFKSALAGIAAEVGPIIGVAAPIAAIGGALIFAGAAALDYSKSQYELELTTYGLGRATGLTADQIGDLAARQADAAHLSEAASEKMTASFIRMGVSSTAILASVNAATDDFAAVIGEEGPEAAKRLAAALVDPERGVDDLAKAIGGFDGATREAIIRMARQNDLAGAQAKIMEIVAKQTRGAADEVDGLSKALRGGGVAWGNFWRDVGRGTTQFFTQFDGQQTAEAFGYLDPAQEEAKDRARASAQRTKAQETADKDSLAAANAYNNLLPKYEQMAKLEAQKATLQRTLTAGSAALAKAGLTEAGAREAVAAAEKKIKDLGLTDEQKKAAREADSAAKAAERRAEQLAREARATEAAIKGNLALAQAYGESEGAALRAQARQEATSRAISKQGDIEAFVARQIRVSVAEQAVSGAKAAATMAAETASRAKLNDNVADGVYSMAEMQEALRDEAQLRPLLVAMNEAEGEAKTVLQKVIERVVKAQRESNDEQRRTQALAIAGRQANQIAVLHEELRLLNSTNRARSVAIAQLQQRQAIIDRGADPDSADSKREIENAGTIAGRTSDLQARRQIDTAAADGRSAALDVAKEVKGRGSEVEQAKSALEQIAELERQNILNHEEAARARSLIDQRYAALRVQRQASIFGTLAQLQDSGNRKLAALGKAAAMTQATIDGVLAVQKALASYPPPLNFAMAAAVGVVTAANVAKIAGFEEGGYTGHYGRKEVAGVVHGQEFVVNADATAKHRGLLEAINDGRSVAGYARGGYVAPAMPSAPPAANDNRQVVIHQSFTLGQGNLVTETVYSDMKRMAEEAKVQGAQMGAAMGIQQMQQTQLRTLGVGGGRR